MEDFRFLPQIQYKFLVTFKTSVAIALRCEKNTYSMGKTLKALRSSRMNSPLTFKKNLALKYSEKKLYVSIQDKTVGPAHFILPPPPSASPVSPTLRTAGSFSEETLTTPLYMNWTTVWRSSKRTSLRMTIGCWHGFTLNRDCGGGGGEDK